MLLLIILVVLLCGGGFFGYNRYYGQNPAAPGYAPSYGPHLGIVGVLLIILLLYWLFSGHLGNFHL